MVSSGVRPRRVHGEFWPGFLLLLVLATVTHRSDGKCAFPAIFNFGDSNSDTGGFWAAFPAQRGPFGMTYFKKPSGRASDGRLIIDFLAQALGLPFLSPYLQSVGANFRHGANFATLASTVLLPNTSVFVTGISPFSLAIQLNQLKELQTRVLELSGSLELSHQGFLDLLVNQRRRRQRWRLAKTAATATVVGGDRLAEMVARGFAA